jgi:threonine 3-dehydrogenase
VKALRKATAGPGFELADAPEPEPGPGELLVRVLRTGICGTDLHIESWDAWAAATIRPPLIPGHEFCGEVVGLGAGVRDVREGDLVSGEGHVVCGTCRNCRAGRRHLCIRTSGIGVNRDGAFAEFVVLPESNAWVQHDVDPDLAAIFDPFGNAVHTALSFPLVGEDVLITGAGPIGLMAAAVCRHVGARFVVITDVSPYRLDLARRMGVDLALDVSRDAISSAQEILGMLEGFDVALEMSGHPSALPDRDRLGQGRHPHDHDQGHLRS